MNAEHNNKTRRKTTKIRHLLGFSLLISAQLGLIAVIIINPPGICGPGYNPNAPLLAFAYWFAMIFGAVFLHDFSEKPYSSS